MVEIVYDLPEDKCQDDHAEETLTMWTWPGFKGVIPDTSHLRV